MKQAKPLITLLCVLAILATSFRPALAARGRPDTPPASPADPHSTELITKQVEDSIDRAYECFKKNQKPNGSWGDENTVGITALVMISFLMKGNFPGEKPYGNVVEKALDYLLKESKSGVGGYIGNSMYCHGLATLALSELWGQSDRDDEIKDALKSAVDVILRSQHPVGGWRYNPEPTDADISVTVMQLVALASARQAGILVPDETIDKAIRYVTLCKDEMTGGYRYQPSPGEPGFARTAAAVVSLQMCGRHGSDNVKAGLAYLFESVDKKNDQGGYFSYGHYYGAIAMYMSGDDNFKKWYPKIRDRLIATQAKDGSWNDAGRNYGSAMHVIILAVPYAFVPAYQR